MSDTFPAEASRVTATYSAGGIVAANRPTAPVPLSVQYDASARSYAILSGQDTLATLQTQGSGAIDGNPIFDVFRAIGGLVTSTLSLTRTGETSRYGTRFVAGGTLQNSEPFAGSTLNQLTSFVFGLRTAEAEVPRTGSASFGVGLLGALTGLNDFQPITGSGLLTLDFSTGRTTGNGVASTRFATFSGFSSPSYFRWSTNGNFSVASNRLQGDIQLELNPGSPLPGTIEGRLFGPSGSELGASFSAGFGQQMAAGTLTGTRGTAAPAFETLATLLSNTSLQQLETEVLYDASATAGRFTATGVRPISQSEIRIRTLGPDAQAIEMFANPLTPATRVDALSDPLFVAYRNTGTTFPTVRTTRLYRYMTPNPELALTYSTFAMTEMDLGNQFIDYTTVFGLATGFVNAPRSGSGVYQGVLHGTAVGAGPDGDRFSLQGSARLEFDWQAQTIGGRLSPVATNLRTRTATPLGDFTLRGSTPFLSASFDAVISGQPGAAGRLKGAFYGPNAEEATGAFSLFTPGAGTVLAAQGAVATRLISTGPSSGQPVGTPPPRVPLTEPWPTPLNPGLDNLTASETFLADARRASLFYPFSGTSALTSEEGQLTVSFDAATGSYTVSSPGSPALPAASETFAPATRDIAASNSGTTIFRTANGSTRNELRLSVAGAQGLIGTRHVGGGIWRQIDTQGGIERNTLHGFTFGYRTPNVDIPRATAADFAIAIEALQPMQDGLRLLNGTGMLRIDWASGQMVGVGTSIVRGELDNGAPRATLAGFTLEGRTTSINLFQTSLSIRNVSSAFGQGYFYGPGGSELGSALTFGTGGAPGTVFSGYLIGARGTSAPPPETLARLRDAASLDSQSAGIDYVRGTGSPTTVGQASTVLDSGRVRLFPGTGITQFSQRDLPAAAATEVGPSSRVAAESDARFTTYRVTGGNGVTTWRVYNSGAGNDQLALSYASFAQMEFAGTNGAAADRSIMFGLGTPLDRIPRTGSATYNGVVHGTAAGLGAAGQDRFLLAGTGRLEVDWASFGFGATLNLSATNLRTNTNVTMDPLIVNNGSISGGSLSGMFGGIYSGDFRGAFFGPDANEAAAHMRFTSTPAGTLPGLAGQAAFVGRRQ
ncbi:hypothetical protein GVO57_11160 [Sphingomonas changnyeongensis]|uniref:Transferrin-binding protein B C-lobe/N-lobe beta barrel domain-containing protein n=1 Tax=Sphingomonas changnyeongensis TaxID=2698679 RepID=A0A7Z2NWS7_9SPHN|nr:hypothetical protein [Sphingomonas changnyeongensis]QHL91268.1 hypothetical protein GVO57_11160 [Sphingomonas changnyeongensis]